MTTEPSDATTSAVAPGDVEVRAVITRADGTVEDLGIIDATYTSPLRRAWWALVGHPLARRRIARANRSAHSRSTA